MAPTILQQEDGLVVFLSDPSTVGIIEPVVVSAGDQPPAERALFFSRIVGFRVEYGRLALNPVAASGGSSSSGEASS